MNAIPAASTWSVWLMVAILLVGCKTTTSTLPPQVTVQAPALPAPQGEPANPPGALSYGMVTGKVQKGVTTQTEILELFGGPSTMTTDRDGTEVWMYEKTTSTTSGNYQQSAAQSARSEASTMAAFLGLPLLGIGGSSAQASTQSAQVAQGQHSVTRSVKTLTFILKFSADKTVKDYAVRQANF